MGNQESHVVRGLPLNCTLKKHSLMGLLHLPPPEHQQQCEASRTDFV